MSIAVSAFYTGCLHGWCMQLDKQEIIFNVPAEILNLETEQVEPWSWEEFEKAYDDDSNPLLAIVSQDRKTICLYNSETGEDDRWDKVPINTVVYLDRVHRGRYQTFAHYLGA